MRYDTSSIRRQTHPGDTRVVSFRSNGSAVVPSTRKQLLFVKQPFPNHNGGLVSFGPDGRLYVGMGDGGSGGDPENRAQNLSSLLGKLLKIDPVKRGARPVIAAYGLRNPWRFSFDRANGDMWIGDVGQDAYEEIDFAKAGDESGANWGWNGREGFHAYNGGRAPAGARDPVIETSHAHGN